MKEVERIITCQIVLIDKIVDEDVAKAERLTYNHKRKIENEIKSRLDADKVDVTDYKCFIHEPTAKPDVSMADYLK